MRSITVLALASMLAAPLGTATADSWKRESDKPQHRGQYERGDHDRIGRPERRRMQALGAIPYGHLPPPGECRMWDFDLPPGRQPPPYRC